MDKQKNSKIVFSMAMAVFGTLGLFTRNISVSSGELALYRAILASALILIYLLITKQSFDVKRIKKEIPLLLFSGVAMSLDWILLFQAYRYTTISVATLSYYFAPVLVTVVCPILFREKLTKKQMFCFIMSTVGVVSSCLVEVVSLSAFTSVLSLIAVSFLLFLLKSPST